MEMIRVGRWTPCHLIILCRYIWYVNVYKHAKTCIKKRYPPQPNGSWIDFFKTNPLSAPWKGREAGPCAASQDFWCTLNLEPWHKRYTVYLYVYYTIRLDIWYEVLQCLQDVPTKPQVFNVATPQCRLCQVLPRCWRHWWRCWPLASF